MSFTKAISMFMLGAFLAACRMSPAADETSLKKLKVVARIKATTGIPAWNNLVSQRARATTDGYTECAEVIEIKGAYLCASGSLKEMNEALARASIYTEGLFGVAPKTIVALDSDAYTYSAMINGHDLRSESLKEFWQDLQAACRIDQRKCPQSKEKELFEQFIVPKLKEGRPFVIVTYALRGGIPWDEVVTHELMHAQYFLEPMFRSVADTFWAQRVSSSDKQAAKEILGVIYNVNDELLLKNEFQAYMLMSGAETSMLPTLVAKYRQPMLDAMKAKGVTPIQVQSDR